MERLLLIDGNSILNRAFYGIMGNKMLMTEDGTYTNAVYGFLSILFKTLEDIKPEHIKELEKLEPFGEGNKMPLFAYKGLKINSIRALTEGKHLKLTLKDDNIIIDAIGFNMGHLVNDYLIGDKVDVVGVLEINSFNGIESVQINLKDIMKSI